MDKHHGGDGEEGFGFLGGAGGGGGGVVVVGHQLGLYGLRDRALQLHSNSHPLCLRQCAAGKKMERSRGSVMGRKGLDMGGASGRPTNKLII